MDIRIFKNTDELNRVFTDLLKSVLAKKGAVNLGLSGGSTPKSLFKYWSDRHANDIDWSAIRFFWGDERCVPPTDDESNFKMTKVYLFENLNIPESNIFRIHGEEVPATEAERYSGVLTDQLESVDGVPSFDILMLGMGDDGHTASIFPYEMDLWDSNDICVVATHPVSGQKRVSLSGKVINAAKYITFLVTGESKAQKVKEIMQHREQAQAIYPAARVAPQNGKLIWFLDNKAAEKLGNMQERV